MAVISQAPGTRLCETLPLCWYTDESNPGWIIIFPSDVKKKLKHFHGSPRMSWGPSTMSPGPWFFPSGSSFKGVCSFLSLSLCLPVPSSLPLLGGNKDEGRGRMGNSPGSPRTPDSAGALGTPYISVGLHFFICKWDYYYLLLCQEKWLGFSSQESFELWGRKRDTKYFCYFRRMEPGYNFPGLQQPGRLEGKAGPA